MVALVGIESFLRVLAGWDGHGAECTSSSKKVNSGPTPGKVYALFGSGHMLSPVSPEQSSGNGYRSIVARRRVAVATIADRFSGSLSEMRWESNRMPGRSRRGVRGLALAVKFVGLNSNMNSV